MTLIVNRLAEDSAAVAQLTSRQMPEVAAAGFRRVLCSGPVHDGVLGQPGAQALRAAAVAAGLAFAHQPVDPVCITPRDVEAFAELFERLPKSVLALCCTGRQSATL